MALVESVAVLLPGNQFPLWAASIFPLTLRGGRGTDQKWLLFFFLYVPAEKSSPAWRSAPAEVMSCDHICWGDLWHSEVQLRWTGEVRSHVCLLPIPFPLLLSEAAVPSLLMQPAASNSQKSTSTCGGWPGDSLVSHVVPRPWSQTQSSLPRLK